MKIYQVLEVTTTADSYEVEANSEEEAIEYMEDNFARENERISRCPELDKTISRIYQCEGEV